MAYYLYEPTTPFEEFVSLALKDQNYYYNPIEPLNPDFDNILYNEGNEIYVKRVNNTNLYEVSINILEPVKFTSKDKSITITSPITKGMMFSFFLNYARYNNGAYLKELNIALYSLPTLANFEYILERKDGAEINNKNEYNRGINIWTTMKITEFNDHYSIGWHENHINFNGDKSDKARKAFRESVKNYLDNPETIINQMQSIFLQYKYKDDIIIKRLGNTFESIGQALDLYSITSQDWIYLGDKSVSLYDKNLPVKTPWNQLVVYNITQNDRRYFTYKFKFDGLDFFDFYDPVELSYEEYMNIINSHTNS